MKTLEIEITFLDKDATCIHPQNDDPMIITLRCDDWEIRRVLMD